MFSYSKKYDKEIGTIINTPYAEKLETLLAGDLNRTDVDKELTTVTTGDTGLFKSTFVGGFFASSEHWFREAVLEQSVDRWNPQTTVKLVHCEGDDVIDFAMAGAAKSYMDAYGARDVSVVPVEQNLSLAKLVGHSDCGSLAYKVTTGLFAKERKETIGY